jgi:hypothetical protein
MKLYIFLKFFEELCTKSNHVNDLFLIKAVTGYDLHPRLIEDLKRYPPHIRQLARALRDIGFSQVTIARLLGTTSANISYHLNKSDYNVPYVNPIMKAIRAGDYD